MVRHSKVVLKSSIYKLFNFAFKFVNRVRIPYPMYFREEFPVGLIQEDIADFTNDFRYRDEGKERGDYSTARAYHVLIPLADTRQEVQGICVSHESGLEVFLVAAGTLIGLEVAKYSIKRVLESIEKSINNWYRFMRKKGEMSWKDPDDSLVSHIVVRTPFWEISLDARFTSDECLKILEYIDTHLLPTESIVDYMHDITDKELNLKVVELCRKVVCVKLRQ